MSDLKAIFAVAKTINSRHTVYVFGGGDTIVQRT
jgi:hypothetical protein